MKTIISSIGFVALLWIQGCSDARPIPAYDMVDPVPSGWRMTPDEAVLAATSYCEQSEMTSHIRLGPPSIVVDEFDGERLWYLGYHQNSTMPGDHFGLLINDSTGEIQYEPGE
ncbi:hypothetical protein Q31b_36190 [Novipirellula aureliae]|uniref:PepSY domain-containing protein n=1 Tax=Novipirellula aureliae TaxID=2527966 RepID=A0A5C6DU96_9BACT|nr:hypothetical protein [Novipirellula aureliae]TWU40272.1 hypothetical protein Q31b_36190 [Novipirellula aureliae]